MMRYCVVCGVCLETHNLNRKVCASPVCKETRKRRNVDAEKPRRKHRALVNRQYQTTKGCA